MTTSSVNLDLPSEPNLNRHATGVLWKGSAWVMMLALYSKSSTSACVSEVNTCLKTYGRKGSGYHSQGHFFPAQKVKERTPSQTCGKIIILHIPPCVSQTLWVWFWVFTCKGHSCCPEMDAALNLCQTLWFPLPQTHDSPAASGTHTPLLA